MTPEVVEAHSHQARCLRCGRKLTAARSVSEGYGRGCRARIRAAAIAQAVKDFTATQVEKARELIADGGLVPTKRPGVYRAVSSKGDGTYLVHVSGNCACPGGLRGRACYHGIAARILGASGKAA